MTAFYHPSQLASFHAAPQRFATTQRFSLASTPSGLSRSLTQSHGLREGVGHGNTLDSTGSPTLQRDTVLFSGQIEQNKNKSEKANKADKPDHTRRNHFLKATLGIGLGIAGAAAVAAGTVMSLFTLSIPLAVGIGIPAAIAAGWGIYELVKGIRYNPAPVAKVPESSSLEKAQQQYHDKHEKAVQHLSPYDGEYQDKIQDTIAKLSLDNVKQESQTLDLSDEQQKTLLDILSTIAETYLQTDVEQTKLIQATKSLYNNYKERLTQPEKDPVNQALVNLLPVLVEFGPLLAMFG